MTSKREQVHKAIKAWQNGRRWRGQLPDDRPPIRWPQRMEPVIGEPLQPLPFTDDPHLSLVFHLWPRAGWRRHLAKLRAVEWRFHQKLLGVAIGPDTEPIDDVLAEFPGWDVTTFDNDDTGEARTAHYALPRLPRDPNAVTFYAHSKGTQDRTSRSAAVRWWTDAMYRTILQNIDGVLDVMQTGPVFVGSFRFAAKVLFTSRHRWHYAGTFYAFRNSQTPLHRLPQMAYHGTEAWPGDCVPLSQSHCMFGEQRRSFLGLYDATRQPREELETWASQWQT